MPIGPSTVTSPYLVGLNAKVSFTSILTVPALGAVEPTVPGDDGPFAGVPDGLGAYDNGDGTITVLVNHEYGPTLGAIRDHGSKGAFIDRLVISKADLSVVSSDDLIKTVRLWNDVADSYFTGTTAFNRFCSGDLPETTALFNKASGLGTTAHIYLTGEEAGAEGRAFAIVADGTSAGFAYELPALGNLSYENIVANPLAQNKTVVALTDDSAGGQIYIYVGEKQASGSEIDKAGLSSGALYGIKVAGYALESAGSPPASGDFTLELIPDASTKTGAQIETASKDLGVTGFFRPEDFAWDPDNPSVAYLTVTASFNDATRVYKLTFNNIFDPAAPAIDGTIEMVVDGAAIGARMFDNLSVENGKIILQEDPGNNAYVARVWEYDIADRTIAAVASFDPARFSGAGAITLDEESSGVLDVTDLLGSAGTRAYLLDAQVHRATDPNTTVEMGQLTLMTVNDGVQAGGNGDDRLEGNGAAEILSGLNGNDVIEAWGGNDTIYGGNGEDRVIAGNGADLVLGERGSDVLIGGFGEDCLDGGQGEDILIGGGDADLLIGGQGGDLFIFDNRGETGSDVIVDFSQGDLLLTTVSLGTGRIALGDDLQLFGSSSVEINNGSVDVGSLVYAGIRTVEGISYFAYATGDSGKSAKPAAISFDDLPMHNAGFERHGFGADSGMVLI